MARTRLGATEAPDTVRSLRARLGMSQKETSTRAGIPLRVASDLEAGRNVGLDYIRKYANALGVETSVLVAAMEREVVMRKVSAFTRPGPRQTCRPPRVARVEMREDE